MLFFFIGCDGRVVKALDSKSNGIFPRKFESCLQRASSFWKQFILCLQVITLIIMFHPIHHQWWVLFWNSNIHIRHRTYLLEQSLQCPYCHKFLFTYDIYIYIYSGGNWIVIYIILSLYYTQIYSNLSLSISLSV